MQLHVILGPPGSGKAGRALQVLREAANAGRDAFLCVPGSVDRARFLRELGGAGSGVLVGVEVGTFDQLVARVAGSPPVRRTDRAMERIIVRDALREVPAFGRAARWSGFLDTARLHVDRLRRARAWGGSEVERAEAELPGEDVAHWRALESRVGDLLDERRLRDDAWFERRAAKALRAGRPGVDAVVVYGFETLAPARIELLERLAVSVPVTVALAWRPGRRVHERAADLRDRWRARGAFIEELAEVPGPEPVLDWLGSELFEDAGVPAPVVERRSDAPAPVTFVDCCGSLQEAEEVVREVALLGARGWSWEDVVVASADASLDGELLLAAFERAGIPARLQARRRAIDVPAGRALHDLLDAVLDADSLRLAAALRAPVFGLDPARVDAVELRLRSRRHGTKQGLDRGTLAPLLTGPLRALVLLDPRGSGAVPSTRELLGELHPADVGELDLLRGIAALVEGLVVAAGGEQHIALADIRDAIAAFPLVVPDRSDAGTVVIASLDDLRSVAFDAVVLRGMHLAAFRARVDDDAEAPAAGRDLLHLAVTRTRRTLRVVRQAAGSDGGHLAPSPAWQELRRLLPDAPLRSRRLGEVVVSPADVRLDTEVDASVALARGLGLIVDDAARDVLTRVEQRRRRRRSMQLTGQGAVELASLEQLSVTSVERYASCSARWFIERRLRIASPDEDRSRLVEGELAHALLQRLVPDARIAGLDTSTLSARAHRDASELAATIDRRGVLDPARIERITEHVLTLIDAESGWQVPDSIEVEQSFGRDVDDSIGPGLDVDGVELVGRVDRIDRYGTSVLLHDYKFGSTDRPANRLIADHNLQLLVYLLALTGSGSPVEPVGALYRAITKAGSPSGLLSAELRELGVISPRTRAGVLDVEERDELLAQAHTVVTEAVAGIRSGRVAPLEDPALCPAHCRLQPICRVGEGLR